MIDFLILLFFFIYNIGIFFINNYFIFIIIFIFNIIISYILKIKFLKQLSFLLNSLPIILFIFICNIFFSTINEALIIVIRLLLIIELTYILNNYLTPTKLRHAITYLFKPLDLFNINTDSLSLIIAISLALIPILIDEATIIKYSLKTKGLEPSIKNIIHRPHIYLITYLNNLFDRLDDLERTLIIKAY